jgi:hypothetical protein
MTRDVGRSGQDTLFSSPDANPFAPPNVDTRKTSSEEDRRDFTDLTTKQLARSVSDLQTISMLGGLPIFVGCSVLAMLPLEFTGVAPVSRPYGAIFLAVGFVLASVSLGVIILRRSAIARPLAILVAIIALPVGIAAIGPFIRDHRLFGPDRIRRSEMRKMERELAYRRKERVL